MSTTGIKTLPDCDDLVVDVILRQSLKDGKPVMFRAEFHFHILCCSTIHELLPLEPLEPLQCIRLSVAIHIRIPEPLLKCFLNVLLLTIDIHSKSNLFLCHLPRNKTFPSLPCLREQFLCIYYQKRRCPCLHARDSC